LAVTKAVVHVDALKGNVAQVCSLAGGRKVLAAVKADAYGHGAVAVARAVLEAGASHLGVARVSEAVELRAGGVNAPILLFSVPGPDEIPEAVEHGVTFLVPGIAFADMILECAQKLGKTAAVHIKVDTGMGRIGIRPEGAPELARFIGAQELLRLDGVCTHLAVSDSAAVSDVAYTEGQVARFAGVVKAIKNAGVNPGIVHAAASGGLLGHSASLFDMVRPGILIYGYAPNGTGAEVPGIRPVMELVTKIAFLKRVRAGESVSYGRRWTAGQDTTVATLPIGYADGLPRTASGKLWFVINGKRCPQIGTVCMDQCMVDLGPALGAGPVRLWDDVTVFGGSAVSGPASLTAASLADIAGTIPYEILCGVGKRVPRIYVA
jgi:alanine racemase